MAVNVRGEVIVLEPEQDLRPADLDALVTTIESWLATHDELPGLVIHACELPGWPGLACMLRHLRFVRDHRARIHRIALATDSRLPATGMRLVELFVAAELKQFVYAAYEQAIRWAYASLRMPPR